MANQGAKKRLEENTKQLRLLQLAILLGVCCYAGIRLFLFGGYTSTWHVVGFALSLTLEVLCYSWLSTLARPTFGANGDLQDGGANLSKPGSMSTYCFDLIYITVFVQVAGSFWPPLWYSFLSVPAYAVYMLVKKVLIPYFSAPSQEEAVLDPTMRKKLEKAEARAQRRRMKWR